MLPSSRRHNNDNGSGDKVGKWVYMVVLPLFGLEIGFVSSSQSLCCMIGVTMLEVEVEVKVWVVVLFSIIVYVLSTSLNKQ